jgi:hypothetical protein
MDQASGHMNEWLGGGLVLSTMIVVLMLVRLAFMINRSSKK